MMSLFLPKSLLACTLVLTGAALCSAPAAQAAVVKKASKAATNKTEAELPALEAEPDVNGSTVTNFDCELGNKVTLYRNTDDDQHIAIRWKKRLMRLTRVMTQTGANRFENPVYGLIWIGIPSKSMLLDSKQNRQLANECQSPEQKTGAGAAPSKS